MKLISACFLLFVSSISLAQNNSLGVFETNGDIGKPQVAGSSMYDAASQTYTVTGAGYNIWFNRDEFQFLYKKLAGDFVLTANFELQGKGKEGHRKVGWMIRESMQDNAAHVSATLHGDGLTVLQWRELRGAYMRDPQDEIFFPKDELAHNAT